MSEALSLSDFAAQLSAADATTGQAQEAPDDEAQELQQIEDDTTEGQDAAEQSTEEGQEETDSEDGQAAKAPDEEMVIKWTTAAGETHEAPLKELKDGYLRQSDYTQKTQQLSQERETAQKAIFQQYQLTQALGNELGQLQSLQSQISQYQQLPWQQIKAEAPERYNALVSEFLVLREQAKEVDQALTGKRNHLESLRNQSALEADAEAAKGFDKAALQAMDGYLTKAGITGQARVEMIAALGNGKAKAIYEAIHKANQWDALQAKKPQIENRAKAIPPKPAARAQSAKPTSQQEQLAKVAASNKTMDAKTFASLLAQTRRK